MDELSEKLGEILNDPASVARIGEMAKSLFGEQEKEREIAPQGQPDMMKIMSLINKFKNSGSSENERLLLALRPHLSEPRQKKVDTAVKILKLLELAPLLTDSGLLENFL